MTRGIVGMAVWLAGAASAAAQWTQWGGPGRDFVCESAAVAAWTGDGPKQLWRRALGEGFSSIVTDGEQLYTMLRRGEEEVVVALDSRTGQTLWEHAYAAPLPRGLVQDFGAGPRATPTIAGERLITIGLNGLMLCLERKTGKRLWAQELISGLDGTKLMHGYCASPLLYKDNLLALVGGRGTAVVAFRVSDGSIAWSAGAYDNSYSSPILIDLDGQKQLVAVFSEQVVGFDADKGEELWSWPHKNQWSTNIVTPVWCPGNLLFVASEGTAGSRMLKLSRGKDETKVEQVWEKPNLRINHATVVRSGAHLFTSIGGAASFLVCVEAASGRELWRERGFSPAKLLRAGEALLLLDEDGRLALAAASPEKCEIRARGTVLADRAWTPPTLVGGRIYVRDNKEIAAFSVP